MIKIEKVWFLCVCGCAVVAVDAEPFDDEKEVGISVYRWGTNTYDTSLRNRLRHIRDILKYGHPWADDVLLSYEDACALGHKLLDICEQ